MEDDIEGEHEQEHVKMRCVIDTDEEHSTHSDEEKQENYDDDKVDLEERPRTFGAKKEACFKLFYRLLKNRSLLQDKEEDEEDTNVEHYEKDNELEEEHANEKLASLPVLPQQQTRIRRALGSFMTPQVKQSQ